MVSPPELPPSSFLPQPTNSVASIRQARVRAMSFFMDLRMVCILLQFVVTVFLSRNGQGLQGWMSAVRSRPPASMPSILDVYDARERQMNCKGLMSKITPRRVIVKSYHEILAKRMIFVQNNKNDRIEARKAAKKTAFGCGKTAEAAREKEIIGDFPEARPFCGNRRVSSP